MPSPCRARIESLETRRLCAAYPFTFGGGGFDSVSKTVQTADGGTVVTGLFSGTTNFARPGEKAGLLTASGDTDVFVASYTATGSLNWALRIGGDYHSTQMSKFTHRDIQISQNRFTRYIGKIGGQPTKAGEYVNDLAVDDSGNILLAGAFRGAIRASQFRLTADQTINSDFYDALVLKIAPTGAITWARQFGGAFDDDAMSVGVDAKSNVTIGGYYSRQIDVDPSSKTSILRTEGRDAGFVIRLNSAGDLAWKYQFDSDSIGVDERNAVNDIAVTRAGEVYLAGTYASKADFDPTLGRFVLKSEGKTDAFLARLNRKGALQWAESTGGEGYDGNSAVALDAQGNAYTAGYFSGEDTDVDPRPGVERLLTAASEDNKTNPQFSDLLISKVTPDGVPVWQDQIGGGYIEIVSDLAVAADGGIYLSGSFFNTMDVDPGRGTFFLSSTLSNTGSIKDNNTRFGRNETYDWFALRLSPRGKFVNAAKFGSADDDYSASLTTLADGNVLLSGRIVNPTGDKRDDRQEQSLIELLNPDLTEITA